MTIRVAHLVKKISGTSIPVEIADKINMLSGITSDIISISKNESFPDIVNKKNVVINGVHSVNDVLDFLIENEYDIVNTHHNVFSKESRKIFRQLNKSKIICVDSQHGHIHYDNKQKLLNSISLFYCDALIYNSHSTANSYNFFERLIVGKKPDKVIHLGVNWGALRENKIKFKNKIERISITARLIPRKNHIAVLRAFKEIKNNGVYLDIIGGGPLREELVKETQRLSIDDRVIFHGYLQDRSDVYRIMSNTDLFVLPTLGEGFCLALAEAMAMGLPVIVSDLKIFHEVLGDSGVFVPPADESRIAESIQLMIDRPDFAWKLGQNNRIRIEKNFTLEKTINNYKNFYAFLVNSKENTFNEP